MYIFSAGFTGPFAFAYKRPKQSYLGRFWNRDLPSPFNPTFSRGGKVTSNSTNQALAIGCPLNNDLYVDIYVAVILYFAIL